MKKKKKKALFKITALFLLFVVIFSVLFASSGKIMREYAMKNYGSVITNATYRAFDAVINDGYDFSSLIKTDKNNDGEIIFVSANSYGVNKIAASISEITQQILNENADRGVPIPIGAFTGIRILAGFGKKVRMKLLSVSQVKTEIVSSFEQAGINQTRHTLTLNLHCETSVVTRPGVEVVENDISLLIYDNLIIGKVPSVFISPMVVGRG